MDQDSAYKEFQSYCTKLDDYLGEELTESDTRAKFIDSFLKDVLGWTEKEIRRERTYWEDKKKAALDYEVGFKNPILVVEAKRHSIDFELPGPRFQLLYSLDGVIQSHPRIWGAIKQARKYCDDNGRVYALVTNGRQFALYKAITVNRPWTTGKVAVFNMETLKSKCFTEVYTALSAATCNPVTLDAILQAGAPKLVGQRIADSAGTQVGRLANQMSDVMEQTIALILRDQPDPDREFLEQCYSVDQTSRYYGKSLEGLLQDPLPLFAPSVKSVRPGSRKDPFARAMAANIERKGIRPPILLIGGKGFGKTTFLHWFMKASKFRESIKGSIIPWLDFKEAGYDKSEVSNEIRKGLIQQLENSRPLHLESFDALQEVFRNKINAEKPRLLAPFIDDPKALKIKIGDLIEKWRSDIQGYLGELIKYATSHCDKRVLIVLDNADQKGQEFQFAVHDVAQQLTTSFPITLVLSLRESTYFKLSRTPRADAFSQQQVFHIRAPKLEPVLGNRFSFLAKQLEKPGVTITSAAGHAMTVENVSNFVDFLRRSLLESTHSPQIREMLTALSNGSIREALNLIYEFLVSGHTKMEDYFWNYATNRTSYIPFHEFLASVLLDEMPFFTEQNSHVFLNIYGRTAVPSDSHFCRLRILAVVERLSVSNSFRPEDYVKLRDLRKLFQSVGVDETVFESHLKTLLRFGLLQADTQATLSERHALDKDFQEISSLHIAAAGQYYMRTLASLFQYCQRIIPDTPVFSVDHYQRLEQVYRAYQSRNLLVPLDRGLKAVEVFLEYLSQEETREHQESGLFRSDLLSSLKFMPEISRAIAEEIKDIRKL